MNKRMLILTIFIGAALVGYTTGIVVAQEIKIGDTSGTPFVSFEDALSSGMYEIRLNDGTGQFQIYDITKNRNSLIIDSNGKIGVGDLASTAQHFTLGCVSGVCNIMTIASSGNALNSVNSETNGEAIFRIVDKETDRNTIFFDIKTMDDGTVCFGSPFGSTPECMLIFEMKGPDAGQVKQTDGSCIANC